jgi:serine/threonine-protein kinase RsbW
VADVRGMDSFRGPAVLDRLYEFQAFVQEKANELGLPAEISGKLALVVEELAVNVMTYAYPEGQGELEVLCLLKDESLQHRFCVRLRDWGTPFNPLASETPNTELNLEERPIGGLGIFLAEEMVDSIYYDREGDSNVLTFCLDLERKV